MTCPDDNLLAAFLEGTLPLGERETVQAHVADCDECRHLLVEGTRHARELASGARVGRYVIERRLGAGGMGVVYAAHDPELDRRVAIKILRDPGVHNAALRLRMQREAQAMARLHHPNVISIFDVGQINDSSDAPIFIAMELVEGQTLRAWLGATRRTYDEIRRAFLAAGRGLLAAHRAGMVHRDFKPDNVLVARDGTVKVTDFGLARALGEALPHAPLAVGELRSPLVQTLTGTGALVGTPAYMAPEQLDGQHVDAASDQFSFCAALYEALAGRRPFVGETLLQLREAIERGPKAIGSSRVAVPRGVERAVLRGLAPDAALRHPTLQALLDVLAVDPRRRRRALLLVGVAGVAVAASFGVGGLWRRPSCVDGRAKIAAAFGPTVRAQIEQRFLAQQPGYATATLRALFGLLDAHTDRLGVAYDEVCAATQKGEQSAALADQRLTCLDARVRETAALTASLATADAQRIERAVDAASRLPEIDRCAPQRLVGRLAPPTDAESKVRIGAIAATLAEARIEAELGHLKEARDHVRELVERSAQARWAPLIAETQLQLGTLEDATGDTKAAARALVSALRAAEAGRADDLAIAALTELVRVDGYRRSQSEAGLAWAEVAAGVLERTGGDERQRAALEHGIGVVLQSAGRYDEARQKLEAALALRRRVLGDRHPAVAETQTQLGFVLRDQGRFAEARVALEAALQLREGLYGASHPTIATTLNQLGGAYRRLGDFDRSLQAHQRALAIVEASLGKDHIEAGYAHNHLGNVYSFRGEWPLALQHFREALRIGERALEPHHWELGMARNNVGLALRWLGRFEEAATELEAARVQVTPSLGAQHPFLAEILTNQGDVQRLLGRLDAARVALETALPIIEKAVGPSHPQLGDPLTALGWIELLGDRLADAEAHLARAQRIRSAAASPRTDLANTELALALCRLRRRPDAATRQAAIAAHDAFVALAISPRERAVVDARYRSWLR